MRILQAIQELRTGGAEGVVVALARGATAAGHEVAVASAPGPLAGRIEGPLYPLPLVGRRLTRLPAASLALLHAIRSFRPNVLHCHNPGVAAAAGPVTLRGRRPPGLVSVHGVPDEDYSRAARVLRLAGLRVVACGPGVAAGLEEAGLRSHETITNGIAPAPEPADRVALAADWRLAPDRPLVLAVGRLVPVKNHELAIRAIAAVPDTELVLVGEGPLAGELLRTADALGVADRVHLVGVRADARALIGAADAVVLPSRVEGLPLVALEALAAGTPLVATAVRGVRELVDGTTAALVPPDDEHALAEGLRRVLGDPSLAAALGRAGRRLAARYREADMVAAYLRLYETIKGTPEPERGTPEPD
jgi:glycosyltransferase involved in cell wall biosynthesis